MANAAQPSPKSRRPLIFAIASAVLVVALAIAAVVATRNDSSADQAVASAAMIETGDVTVSGAPLVTPPEAPATDPAIGAMAPTLTGIGFDGSAVSVTPGERPTVVMFVAHWCPHCQREVPQLVKWLAAGLADGVDMRAVATSTDAKLPNYPPSSWLAAEGFNVPTLVDSATSVAASAYGLDAFPYFVALDARGIVTKRMAGELTEAQFTELVAAAKA